MAGLVQFGPKGEQLVDPLNYRPVLLLNSKIGSEWFSAAVCTTRSLSALPKLTMSQIAIDSLRVQR